MWKFGNLRSGKLGIRLSVGLLVSMALAASCRRAPTGPIALAVPGRTGAHATLAADGDRVAAVWAATSASGVTDIYLATSDDAGRTFAAPVRVNDIAGDVSAGGEQPPRVIVKGSAVDVVWVSKRDGVAGIRAATSTDGGRTFASARSITPAGVTGARGWESASLGADGVVHAVWLDGRNHVPPSPSSNDRASAGPKAAAPAGKHQHEGAPMRQDIYHAMWKGDEAPIETAVAANVCFCCKTAIVSRGADVFVAWRHLFPGGVRDIAIARSSDGGRTFQEPTRVSADNWQIDACPDDGPAMTVDGEGVLRITWPTLVTDGGAKRVIFETTSRDGGATFSPRTRVDTAEGGAAHPRIATGPAGRSAVVWDELAQGSRRVVFRLTGEGSPVVLSTGRIASYPAIAAVGDGFVVAWTDQSDQQSTIRALRVQ
jgi:hypothetical protein